MPFRVRRFAVRRRGYVQKSAVATRLTALRVQSASAEPGVEFQAARCVECRALAQGLVWRIRPIRTRRLDPERERPAERPAWSREPILQRGLGRAGVGLLQSPR